MTRTQKQITPTEQIAKQRMQAICSSAQRTVPKSKALKSTCHQHATARFVTSKRAGMQSKTRNKLKEAAYCWFPAATLKRSQIERSRSTGMSFSIRSRGQGSLPGYLRGEGPRLASHAATSHCRSRRISRISAIWVRWWSIQYRITCPKESET